MTTTRHVRQVVSAALLVSLGLVLGRVAWIAACGPDIEDVLTVSTSVHPGSVDSYRRGELGVVRPHFARRYLVQAYRVLNGRPALANGTPPAATPGVSLASEPSGHDQWFSALQRFELRDLSPPFVYTMRLNPERYQSFVNCPDDAFKVAARTLAARSERFGANSAAVREWTQAQAAVFANCSGEKLVLPAVPTSTDPLLRADYAYQTAAAYFYATQYEEAAARFRQIADDTGSPWQPYGRYLAARATIRQATVPDHELPRRDELLTSAAAQLREVLGDVRAASLHASTRGLLDFIAARMRQFELLESLSHAVADSPAATDRQLEDYRRLMDRLLGDTVEYAYESVASADRIAATHELNDWILATQGGGELGLGRALARWKETRSPIWLVSVLWNLPADHESAAAIEDAAAAVAPSSPAYATVTFLRLRLLLDQERGREARELLSRLPKRPEKGFDADAVNLLNAARFRAADSFDELLASATRLQLPSRCFLNGCMTVDDPVVTFDEDAGTTFTSRLPLTRLADAAERQTLPDRLRVRVAAAAFTRAFFLQRRDTADRSARVLRELAPAMRADLDAFLGATSAQEERWLGVLLLLRTPGLHAYVRGLDDDLSVAEAEPPRKFDHMLRRNWWCSREISQPPEGLAPGWGLMGVLYTDGRWPYPAFVSDQERVATEGELTALRAAGPPQGYLADQAVAWARAQPGDLRAAEALALAVEAGRWTCSVSASSRRAFQTLHRQFPQSEWAKRTKYWYEGWPQW